MYSSIGRPQIGISTVPWPKQYYSGKAQYETGASAYLQKLDQLDAEPVEGVKAQGAPSEAGLAETGGSSMTPYVAGGAVALLAAGGAAVALTRRRG